MARWKHVGTDVVTGTTCERCGKANLREGFYRRELYCGACYYLYVEGEADEPTGGAIPVHGGPKGEDGPQAAVEGEGEVCVREGEGGVPAEDGHLLPVR